MGLMERFLAKISPEPNTGCWLWMGRDNGEGYGTFYANGRLQKAHRFSYELNVGKIPDGLQIDHLCRVRCCVNPAHLEPVTQKENVARGLSRERSGAAKRAITHCPHGHEYSPENTSLTKRGHRRCMACHRGSEKARYDRKVGKVG